MAVVERMSHFVGVMYLGRIVELGSRKSVFESPKHPYTQALMKAVPIADPHKRKSEDEINFKPISSPINPLEHSAAPSSYKKVGTDHYVIETDVGYS